MADVTLGFIDGRGVNGWSSFYSYIPDWMINLNNKFYTFKAGQLYIHDSENVNRGNFYGTDYPSKVSVVFNESPSQVKNFRTLETEGTSAWDATITSYQSEETDTKTGTVDDLEFIEKEGRFHAHTRRNETVTTKGKSTFGIGEVSAINGSIVTMNDGVPTPLTVGDEVLRDNSGTAVTVGTVTALTTTTITLSSVSGLSTGNFIMGRKSTRVEGEYLRGYAMRVDLEKSSTTKEELYAINTRVHNSNR